MQKQNKKIKKAKKSKGPAGGSVITGILLISLVCLAPGFSIGSTVENKGDDRQAQKTQAPAEKRVTEYQYNPVDKTDPFASFITERERRLQEIELQRQKKFEQLGKARAYLESLKEAKTELQKIDLSQLELTGIIRTHNNSFALVKDPKGMGYVVKRGTRIGRNGGIVDKVIREEKESDFGKEFIRKIFIKEPYLDDEGDILYKTVEMVMPDFLE